MKYFSMFSGIGGFELGIQRVFSNRDHERLSCVGFSEIDKYAIQIYKKHFKHKGYGDAARIIWKEVEEFDCLVGGFPCQAFSLAGNRRGFKDTRGTLFFEIARCLEERKPRFCVLENVKGLLSHDKGNTFFTILTTLEELGYDVEWQVLNSKDFCVPQNRERVFIVGHLRGSSGRKVFPLGSDGEGYHKLSSSPGWVQSKASIGGCIGTKQDRQHNTFIVHNLQTRSPNRPSLTKICPCGSGKLYKKCCGVDGGSGHLSRDDGVTYCLDSSGQGVQVGDMRIRRLTPLECERLQGFPDGWTEGISDTQRYKCIGNAVTVNVIEAIFTQIFERGVL